MRCGNTPTILLAEDTSTHDLHHESKHQPPVWPRVRACSVLTRGLCRVLMPPPRMQCALAAPQLPLAATSIAVTALLPAQCATALAAPAVDQSRLSVRPPATGLCGAHATRLQRVRDDMLLCAHIRCWVWRMTYPLTAMANIVHDFHLHQHWPVGGCKRLMW